VYVTGLSWTGAVYDYATIAYNTATGAQQWIKLYAFPGNTSPHGQGPVAEAVSPTSGTVIVTGATLEGEWATVAYSGRPPAPATDAPGDSPHAATRHLA
jgi:hypothetical protein